MTIIAQNDRNYLKIKNLCIEKIFQLKMDQFWPNLQLPKFKIQKVGQIICLYVNTHVLKSESGYFVTFGHGYSTYLSK